MKSETDGILEAQGEAGERDGRLNRQGRFHMMPLLGGFQMRGSPHTPARVLRVDVGALMGFSHIYSPDDLNNTLLPV